MSNATGRGAPERIEPYVWRIAGVVVLGTIMSLLDTTIVNVALNTLSDALDTPVGRIQWVITGYLLALAVVIPLSGWAARRVGASRLYVVSLALFTAASALCGLAHSLTTLILFRAFQGAAGGIIAPVGQIIVAQAAGPKRMGRVLSVLGIGGVLAPIVGPALGGAILDHFSWQWIFYVNVPIGIAAAIAAARVLPADEPEAGGRLDLLGLALLATGLAALVYALSEIATRSGLTSPAVIAPLLVGLALLATFVAHALRAERPLLDVRLYARPIFTAAAATTVAISAALFGAVILMPLYLQQVRGYDVLDSGLLVAPGGAGGAIAMPIGGRLTDRLGGGRIALAGVLITTLGTLPLALLTAHTALWIIAAAQLIRGIGVGLALMPAMSTALRTVRRDELSDASPQMSALQRIGATLGTAILAVVLQT